MNMPENISPNTVQKIDKIYEKIGELSTNDAEKEKQFENMRNENAELRKQLEKMQAKVSDLNSKRSGFSFDEIEEFIEYKTLLKAIQDDFKENVDRIEQNTNQTKTRIDELLNRFLLKFTDADFCAEVRGNTLVEIYLALRRVSTNYGKWQRTSMEGIKRQLNETESQLTGVISIIENLKESDNKSSNGCNKNLPNDVSKPPNFGQHITDSNVWLPIINSNIQQNQANRSAQSPLMTPNLIPNISQNQAGRLSLATQVLSTYPCRTKMVSVCKDPKPISSSSNPHVPVNEVSNPTQTQSKISNGGVNGSNNLQPNSSSTNANGPIYGLVCKRCNKEMLSRHHSIFYLE